MTKSVFIITGEPSGDLLASKLVEQVKQKDSSISWSAFGGSHLKQQGVSLLFDSASIAVVGIIEILTHIRAILSALKLAKKFIREQKPDLLILVDYPGFNIHMAKYAKKHGVRVLYYVSPQIWAWRKNRIHKIKKRVDHMAVIFPFEKTLYEKHHVPATFVGHPLVNTVKKSAFANEKVAGPPIAKPCIALLPGSRKNEIKYCLPVMLASADRIKQHYPNATFFLPLAPSICKDDIKVLIDKYELPISIAEEYHYDVISQCDAAIVTSGTITLEVALLGTPMVIIYKMSRLTYLLAKLLIGSNQWIGLCNIAAQKQIATELIQHDANVENIYREIDKCIKNPDLNIEIENIKKTLDCNPEQLTNLVLSQLYNY